MPLSAQTPEDRECLKWATWDLVCLERALDFTPRRKAAVQAGGNLGVFASRLSEVFEAVYTFEPDAHLFPQLVANTPQANVVRFQAALGDEARLIDTQRTTPENTHSGVTHVAGPGILPMIRLDDLKLPACDLLYLDVEGYELFALKGADETIKAHKPTIAVEVNKCCGRYGYEPKDLAKHLMLLGYAERAIIHSDHIWTPV